MSDAKEYFTIYLQRARDALVWKVEGLSEYDARRPMTPTGTNLLGLVKHATGVEMGYLGACFGRPFPEPVSWFEENEDTPYADMWATPDESRQDILDRYQRVWAHADETIAVTDLDATGEVPWWPAERRHPALHRVLVHVVTELHRHAGHADIVRESIDGSAGLLKRVSNLPDESPEWWQRYRDRLEKAAREAG